MSEQVETVVVPKKRTRRPNNDPLVAKAREQLKEARAVSKLAKLVDGLSAWGLDEINARIQKRKSELPKA